ncbi:MAG: signal peptidase I [Candidatus Eremiobacteraeota bacterium]|nr:signal peptidase I [Candidatus Eremiobacteraeota bacterium]
MLGLIAVFAVARVALSIRTLTAGDKQSSAVALVREYVDAFIVAGLVAMLLITFVVRTYFIPSVSMVPTLEVGDVLLVSELEYRLHPPRAGDLAVFMPPIDSGGNEFIKRVIGVPGDTIRISDGIVYRNGIALREPYENEPPKYDLEIKNYAIYVNGTALNKLDADIPPKSSWSKPNQIPAGFYFMLGDNRNYSDDSHAWGFAQGAGRYASGPLAHGAATASFAGRAFMIFWPLGRFGVLH